jgi:CubicO group peptidase (beta-lactamase class C family)
MSVPHKVLSEEDLVHTIDGMMAEHFKPDKPGTSIILTRHREPLFRKGYGMANLELGVSIEPHMVFRLGSITKQFTAVSILMLYEQGKLSMDDDLTKFLPDYPTQAHHISVEHLLTHTSGIKSYTSMPEWQPMMRKDLTLEELIDLFKNQPMEFAPGTKFNYNNSGYVLLGAIIEKISGMTYEEFLQKNIFDPLGMKDSYYDNPNRIIPGRANGYKPAGEDDYENADYISMTQPYAAGSLASNVDDMAKWDEALYTEKLLKQETLQKAWTPYTLKDGKSTGYGYGWAASHFQDHHMIIHGGGINGFITDGFRFPDEHVYVCILTNRGKVIPNDLAFKIGAIVTGKPYQEPEAIELDPSIYPLYTGVYKIEDMPYEIPVTLEDEHLMFQMPGGEKSRLLPVSKTEFFTKESVDTISFELDENGAAKSVTMRGFYGPGMKAHKTDKPLPGEKQEVELDPSVYTPYVGEYELAPGVKASFTVKDGEFYVTVPGQPPYKLHAESETSFFLKEAPISIVFQKEATGKVTGILLNQAGNEMPGKKVK